MPSRLLAPALVLLTSTLAVAQSLPPRAQLDELSRTERAHEESAQAALAALARELDELERTDLDVGSSREARQLAKRIARLQEAYEPSIPWGWYAFGLLAQTGFFCRFLVQWLASERAGRSIVPVAFWYLSILGSLMLLSYAVFHLRDPIIILGQSTGLIIYTRNLVLLGRAKRTGETTAATAASPAPDGAARPGL